MGAGLKADICIASLVMIIYTTAISAAQPVMIPGTTSFIYKIFHHGEMHYYRVDPVLKSKTELFDRKKAAPVLSLLQGSPINWKKLDIDILSYDEKLNAICFFLGEKTATMNCFTGTIKLTEKRSDNPLQGAISLDSHFLAVVKDDNLYISSTQNDPERSRQVTFDGDDHFSISVANLFWSPDSSHLAFLRRDLRKPIARFSLWIYHLRDETITRASTHYWPDQTIDQVKWNADSSILYLCRRSADAMNLDLCAVDPSGGQCTPLIREKNQLQVNNRLPYFILANTGNIIWWSAREGWGRYYMHDSLGTLINPVTSENCQAGKIIDIQEDPPILWFMGQARKSGRNSQLQQLYSVMLSGDNLKRLTPEGTNHEVTLIQAGSFFLDTFYRPDLTSCAVVRDTGGDLIMDLGCTDVSPIRFDFSTQLKRLAPNAPNTLPLPDCNVLEAGKNPVTSRSHPD